LVDLSEATDSGFLEELVASVFGRVFQRQLILGFLVEFAAFGFLAVFSEKSYSTYLHLTSFYGNMGV
jgi:hypothetical protein